MILLLGMALMLGGHVLAAVFATIGWCGRMPSRFAVHCVLRHRPRKSRRGIGLSGGKRRRSDHDDHFKSPEFE
jgi:hypothetical protein